MFPEYNDRDHIGTQREREEETQAEREAGSMQGARCKTRSQDPGVTT